MNLVWKLLRQHVSLPQFAGFLFANMVGMIIVMLGFQFYRDVLPVFTQGDTFMKDNYMTVQKKIGNLNAFSGESNAFTTTDVEELKSQPFTKVVGAFTASEFKVSASMGIKDNEASQLSTEMFFESVPDRFVDVNLRDWTFKPGDIEIPIIMPRTYLNMYNFGFAQSHSLPKISEGLMGMINFDIFIRGAGKQDHYRGRIIGFSSRLNTILAPEAFIKWANQNYAPGKEGDPQRVILEVVNPADEAIVKFCQHKNYELEDDKLDEGKTTWFLKLTVSIVMVIGLIISILAFYILMLSIYLLVQKNSSKLENLLLIGYSPSRVAMPYQLLTLGLNLMVLLVAILVVGFIRGYYMEVIELLFPQIDEGTLLNSAFVGGVLFVLVSFLNIIIIYRKIISIWKRKE